MYLVNTYDLPSRPLFQLPALTLHESAPGHAFQIPLAAENKALPPFRRNSYISAYGEGWALYCERLGDEMGFYETPYDRFGMLSYQMWRAARLVVDTGIHAKGWSRARAQAFLHDNTALSDHEIETEVDRYIGWPGQALSYYIGELTIERSRAKAEKGTRREVRYPGLPRYRAEPRLGADAGARGANRSLHRGGRQGAVSRRGEVTCAPAGNPR